FFLDIAGFATFLLLMGRLGTTSIAATSIAFNINNLAFMPMIGFGIAVSVLVGQHLGNNRPDLAERSAYSGFYLTFLYMAILASSYILVPGIYLKLFASHSDPGSFAPIRDITIILLRFVAIYSIFDTLNIIFAAAIKGAGDTRFVMVMLFFISFFILVIPSYFALVVFKMSIYVGWGIASTYIITLGIGFFIRFKGGKWKSMRVIEKPTPTLPSTFPETPTPDI
ncbi:MAG: MATE family efflux transporter, partial [Candidatus Marinimicrobia bacterium]|nr:MATE family efflux transporter [Candidatus Neomarinimicrobiota bacterium]